MKVQTKTLVHTSMGEHSLNKFKV